MILKPSNCLFSAGSLYFPVPCFLPKARTCVQSWKNDPSLPPPCPVNSRRQTENNVVPGEQPEGNPGDSPAPHLEQRDRGGDDPPFLSLGLPLALSPLSLSPFLSLSYTPCLTLFLSRSVHNSGEKLNNSTTQVGKTKVKILSLQQVRLVGLVSVLLILHLDLPQPTALPCSHAGVLIENRGSTAEKFNESSGNLGLCKF